MPRTHLALLLALASCVPPLAAQEGLQEGGSAASARRAAPPVLEAVPITTEEPRVDGDLSDPVWRSAPVASDFVQYQPNEGAAASERTEVRVLYGVDALYVAFRAFDREPDLIAAQLARRDDSGYSDRVHVVIDSYFDRRTAFQFAVNPLGVKSDWYRFDDTQEDSSWDAVWDVAVQRDDEGWSAEFRIPYSQLRFESAPIQTWGINFMREVARRQERSVWAPLSQQENATVSRFGELRGLKNLTSPRHMELLPYTVARLTRATGDLANPFYERNDVFGTVGADLKYGVTSNLTLDLTVNPDFGQVEADPGQVNLSAFEAFFAERRPFFVEGSSIFNFRLSQGDGDDANESLFYSRRIGRAPQGSADAGDGWSDADAQTSILGAWKLSGKTADGWSVGLLHAVTGEERARIGDGVAAVETQAVEPLTNYVVGRVMRDFREGRSAIGLVATGVNRDREVSDRLDIRSGGYTGGVDFRHRFANDEWEVQGFVVGSWVTGSAEAIESTQRSSARFFQRPDAEHVEVDPTRTSMAGWSSNLNIGRYAGGFWRYATGFQARSPGFEANDIGFMRSTDYVSPWAWLGYHHTTPTARLNRFNVNVNLWSNFTFARERTGLGGNVNGSLTFKNFWGGYAGVGHNVGSYSTTMLRGGPLFRTESSWNGWMGAWSDSRRPLRFELNGWGGRRPESGSWNVGVGTGGTWRASNAAQISLRPQFSYNVDDRQWVQRIEAGGEDHYLLARLEQKTFSLTTRVDYTFTPELSLQLYAQPFLAGGAYRSFKTVADPRAEQYDDRLRALGAASDGDAWTADVDGDGSPERWDDPDFAFGQFRSNVVLRWEYRPGSALFLVWSQGRDRSRELDGSFELGRDLDRLFSVRPDNVFLIKVSYWLNP
ncbi:MAG: DUF5916 domain-containing protein [Gemmatimonadota bacterium]|nr:carbohydrate binding family 9 domain-containing protein [Gemmatimonadota bacterium]